MKKKKLKKTDILVRLYQDKESDPRVFFYHSYQIRGKTLILYGAEVSRVGCQRVADFFEDFDGSEDRLEEWVTERLCDSADL
jgi:hypothetical protein